MLIVPTFLRFSPIHGLGLFTSRDILPGELIACWVDGFDLTYPESVVEALPVHAQQFLRKYAYREKLHRRYRLNGDNLRFMNHSKDNNVGSILDLDVALCEIPAGWELTTNYHLFDDDADWKLSQK